MRRNSTRRRELYYFVHMLQDLKLERQYDGFLYLAEARRNPPKLRSHHHVELELNLVVRGTITYVVGKRRLTFPARTLVWLFPEQEHQLVDATDDFQNYIAVFRPSLIRQACHTPRYEGLLKTRTEHDGVLHMMLEPETFDLVRKTMDSLMPDSLNPDLLNKETGFGPGSNFVFAHNDPDGLNAGLHHLLLLCWRSNNNGQALGSAVPLHPSVRRVIKILSEGTAEETLSDLATQCKVSEAFLSRTFHRQVGVTMTRYRNSLRLARFWELYKQADERSLAEIVYDAGFGSYGQFYKIFVQTYGHGPRVTISTVQ